MNTLKTIIIIFLILLSIPSFANQKWQKLENDYFIIKYPAAEQKLADKTMDILMENRRRVNYILEYEPKHKTDVYICDTDQRFRELTKGGVPDWGAGCAYPKKRLIILKSPKLTNNQVFSYHQTVVHEYTHIALGQVIGDTRIPTWFHEGMAMHLAGQFRLNDRATISWASITGKLLPLSSLDMGFPYHAPQARLAYLQSLTTIEFIMDNWEERGLSKLLQTIKQTGNFDSAMTLAWGINRKRFEDGWKSYINKKYNWGMIISNPFFLWIGISLLFLIGYWRKNRRKKKTLKQWELEELEQDLGIKFENDF